MWRRVRLRFERGRWRLDKALAPRVEQACLLLFEAPMGEEVLPVCASEGAMWLAGDV